MIIIKLFLIWLELDILFWIYVVPIRGFNDAP